MEIEQNVFLSNANEAISPDYNGRFRLEARASTSAVMDIPRDVKLAMVKF